MSNEMYTLITYVDKHLKFLSLNNKINISLQ